MESVTELWSEARARADSIANAVFLLAGGALSLSIATLLGSGAVTDIDDGTKCTVVLSWWLLAYSVVAFLLVKGLLVVQAYKKLTTSSRWPAWHRHTTFANWILSLSGLAAFFFGIGAMVYAAASIL